MLITAPVPEARPVQTYTPISYTIQQENDPYQPRISPVIKRNFTSPLTSTLQEIFNLQERTSGWDGYNAPAPDPRAVTAALSWVQLMYVELRDTHAGWVAPYVSSDEGGNVSLEWWKDGRKLTIYVLLHIVEYVQVWGPRLLSDMTDGNITHPGQARALWNWLHA